MRRPRAVLLVAVVAGPLVTACRASHESSDANSEMPSDHPTLDTGSSEPASDGAALDGDGEDAGACYPLFHACTSTAQCCAPNLCLNITGSPACQVEGPARTPFTSWTSCGWSSSGTCLCDGIHACEAVAGGTFSALGSQQARVCAIDGDVCEYVVFVETEGGGTARRCRVPINSGSCQVGFGDTTDSQCVDLFTCNLLLGNCPSDIMPGTSVITCR